MDRVILHCDANSYYASVECLYTPAIRDQPVAVSGNAQDRHGIILTKNPIASSFGVKTGEAIWQAREKCPHLLCVPPDYPLYIRFSRKMRRIYEQYTPFVESFGLDEAWLDLSGPRITLRDGERMAHVIRRRVRDELGITISIGVANNKIFAKLGSDMKKPDAVTCLPPQDYPSQVFPLPVGNLLFVGRSTQRRLSSLGILTIGELAHCPDVALQKVLGKTGLVLKTYASGQDRSPVLGADQHNAIQSVGNSTTPPHDIENMDDARCIFFLLAQSVAARLRAAGLRARCISISARSTSLLTRTRQMMLPRSTCLTDDIAQTALRLFEAHFTADFPFRSVGVSSSHLCCDGQPVQLDFTGDEEKRMHMEHLEHSIDDLRRRYGHQIVTRGVVLCDRRFAAVNPVEDHTIHPVPFYSGKER